MLAGVRIRGAILRGENDFHACIRATEKIYLAAIVRVRNRRRQGVGRKAFENPPVLNLASNKTVER